MHKILIGALLGASLNFSASGCDYRSLRSDAESYNSNIWAKGMLPSIEEIKGRLSFLHDEQKVDPKYRDGNSFFSFYEETMKSIKNQNFIDFLQNCKTIYEISTNDKNKAAIYMLAEEVKINFLKELKMSERMKEFNQTRKRDRLSRADADNALRALLKGK